jgi:hypothetical protein
MAWVEILSNPAPVAWLRVLGPLPAGLPLNPLGNGRPRWRCFVLHLQRT